jgi:hypothetical protein
MAVDRRIPIGGSIRSLSPTEGKFRVKGTAWGCLLLGLFLDLNAPRINQDGHFPPPRDVPTRLPLFSLGRTILIIDNACS